VSAVTSDITSQAPSEVFDVAVLRSLIQVLSPDQAARAIKNVGKCIRAGGEIYILGYVLDQARASPWEAAAWDVAFINIYDAGQSYTDQEYREWLQAAGFGRIERQLMGNNMSLITARKA
ncbi:MAG: methyltransferase, partial [Deltaproteobacteria bacterium]|nr:methyltransferase [Deltaproteobacteria bacterium]